MYINVPYMEHLKSIPTTCISIAHLRFGGIGRSCGESRGRFLQLSEEVLTSKWLWQPQRLLRIHSLLTTSFVQRLHTVVFGNVFEDHLLPASCDKTLALRELPLGLYGRT